MKLKQKIILYKIGGDCMKNLFYVGPEDGDNDDNDEVNEPLPDWDWENTTLDDLDF